VEKLEEELAQLREEEQQYAAATGEEAAEQRRVLAELEAKVAASEQTHDKYEGMCVETHRTIEALRRGIGSMFTKIDCDGGSALAAKPPAVTEANILQYLGVIEARVNDVLQQYAAVQQKERQRLAASEGDGESSTGKGSAKELTAAVLNVLGSGPTVPMGQELIHVNPPKLDDYSSEEGSDDDDDDEDFRPLTRDELKAKALNRMGRRGGGKKTRK